MKFSKILACYHPTAVLFVDDNTDFLKSTLLNFMNKIPCLTYNNPQEVLNLLKRQEYQTQTLLNRYVNGDENSSDELSLKIGIKSLYKEIYSADKFSIVTVIVTDHAMPGLKGIELCKQLKANTVKKIMLTGKMSHFEAVQAFNNNDIDKFIMKVDPDLPNQLADSIEAFLQKQFLELTEIITNGSTRLKKLFTDPATISLFNDIYCANNIAEYYLIDELGSFLLLDNRATPYLLLIRTEQDMLTLYNHATIEHLSPTVIKALKNREVIPCSIELENFDIAPIEWKDNLLPAKELKGEQTYYYSFVANPNLKDLNSSNITAYQKYLTDFRPTHT